MLRNIQKVFVAALELRIPIDNVKLRRHRASVGSVLREVGRLEGLGGWACLSVESHGVCWKCWSDVVSMALVWADLMGSAST